MIGYFPKLYPDELMYSYLARLAVANGYIIQRQLSLDLYGNNIIVPSKEFINPLKPEVIEHITRQCCVEDIILKHTMFPCYAEFLPEERKKKAIRAIWGDGKNLGNLLQLPNAKTIRFFRYCPECVKNDREVYGETYWHRIHQVHNIEICPMHGCRLYNSDIQITGNKRAGFITAESSRIECAETIFSSPSEKDLVRYIEKVVNLSRLSYSGSIALLLNQRLSETKYQSKRGAVRYMGKFSADIQMQRGHLEAILKSGRFDFAEICRMAIFLNISPEELVNRTDDNSDWQEQKMKNYEADIQKMLTNGMGINQIARQCNISSKTVRDIRDGKHKTVKCPKRGKGGKKRKNWESIDQKFLPIIIKCVGEMCIGESGRPKKITISGVTQKAGLPDKAIDKMPICKDYILQHTEKWESYWARELEWAYQKVVMTGAAVNWKQLRNLTNISKKNAIQSIPYINNDTVKQLIRNSLLKKAAS